MTRPKTFKDCKTIKDALNFRYLNPSYGGAEHPDYKKQKYDDDYEDWFWIKLRDSNTNKVYDLVCEDVRVEVQNETKSDEAFEIWVNVSNIPLIEAKRSGDYTLVQLHSKCLSPFNGKGPTEYSEVECIFSDVDLSHFDKFIKK